jgi:hypothetical protein
MEALVIRLGTRHGRGWEHHKLAGEVLSVGRALHNDLILADPYLGAEQFRIHRDGERILLDILDATNPATLNGKPCAGHDIGLQSGDRIAIGQSVIEVLLESASVAPTRSMPSTLWSRLGNWRPVLAFMALLSTGLSALYIDYLDTYEELDWGELLSGPVFLVLLIVCWASLWAIVGRVLRNQPGFSSHLFVSALTMLLAMNCTLASGYIGYASGFARVAYAVDWFGSALLSFTLLYFNLRFATSLRRPWIAAASTVLLLVLLIYGFEWIGEEEFMPYPPEESLLKPPFAKLRDGVTVDEWDETLRELFREL